MKHEQLSYCNMEEQAGPYFNHGIPFPLYYLPIKPILQIKNFINKTVQFKNKNKTKQTVQYSSRNNLENDSFKISFYAILSILKIYQEFHNGISWVMSLMIPLRIIRLSINGMTSLNFTSLDYFSLMYPGECLGECQQLSRWNLSCQGLWYGEYF